ncbi:MAG: rubredoxin [Bacilli bacterium]|jgi:rubredoxin
MKKYRCLLCGFEFESDDPNPVCPVCGASGDDIQEIKEDGDNGK